MVFSKRGDSVLWAFIGLIHPLFIAHNIYQRHKSLHFYGFLWPLPLSLCRQSVPPPLLEQKKSLEYIIKKIALVLTLQFTHIFACCQSTCDDYSSLSGTAKQAAIQPFILTLILLSVTPRTGGSGMFLMLFRHKMSAGINFIFTNSFEL